MVLDAVLTRFVEKTPLTVMAYELMQRALAADWIDALFEKHRERQYTRELLFSSTVELMSLVAVGLQPSVHAAAKTNKELPVTLTALYNKLNRTETHVVAELVRGSSQRPRPGLGVHTRATDSQRRRAAVNVVGDLREHDTACATGMSGER